MVFSIVQQWQVCKIDGRFGCLLLTALYCTAAVGVVGLCRHFAKLTREVLSIARHLNTNHQTKLEQKSSRPANELVNAINACLDGCRNTIEQLKGQVQDLQIQTQLWHKQKKNTEAIIYSLRDAVLVIDAFDRLSMANESAGKLFDFDFKTSPQKHVSELIGPDKSDFLTFLSQVVQSEAEATRREITLTKSSKPHTFDCVVCCIRDENDMVCGAVAVLHDITREKEVSQMKNDFVSHVSHELKTPLASITAYSEMLVDGEADDERTRKEFYSVIQSQAQRLNRLIEDILNISRIESGLVKLNKEPISLTILIEEQLQMIRTYAEEKNIKIVSEKPIVYDQVYADKDMISQVVVNLLSNAVKYTPSGGSVRIHTEVDQADGVARVSVTDTGVGIPDDEIEHLFEKFHRVAANKKMASGTGLGLNLVKQIIEKAHNGRVFVKSKVGIGSTFGFELPLATKQMVEVA
jgi:two-component system phosphate regulon sensor histidine kinase PhoR